MQSDGTDHVACSFFNDRPNVAPADEAPYHLLAFQQGLVRRPACHAEDAPACITHRLEFVPDGERYHYLLSKID